MWLKCEQELCVMRKKWFRNILLSNTVRQCERVGWRSEECTNLEFLYETNNVAAGLRYNCNMRLTLHSWHKIDKNCVKSPLQHLKLIVESNETDVKCFSSWWWSDVIDNKSRVCALLLQTQNPTFCFSIYKYWKRKSLVQFVSIMSICWSNQQQNVSF